MYEIAKSFDMGMPVKYPMQTKNFLSGDGSGSFINHLLNNNHFDLSAHMQLHLFKRTAPLFNAIDIITEEIGAIKPIIWDRVEEKPVRESAVLDLLNNPNPQTSGPEFLQQMASYFLITGNNFLLGTGGISRPPLELMNISPSRINPRPHAEDSFVGSYILNTSRTQITFTRVEENREFRFINSDDKEMWQSKTFNPNQDFNSFFGLSKLMPIFFEIEQYNESSVHNLALLRNGATVKGILSTEGNLTDDQYARLEEELNNHHSGSENAGRPMITEGGLKWENMAESLKDMDFLNLRKDSRNSIFNTLRIPLPLVTPDKMTLSNMDSARVILYDNAVLPLYNRLLADLTSFLFPRFDIDTKRFALSFIEQDIPALAERFLANTERLAKIGAYSHNELRSELGKGEIENGDTVYIPLNLIPLGDDLDTSDQSPEDTAKQLEMFERFLKAKTDGNGDRIYSDAQIEDMAKEHGLIE